MSQDNHYPHNDSLAILNRRGSLKDKLSAVHHVIQKQSPFIARISLALYDPETKILKTYIHSSGDDNPLENYQTLLDNAPSLKECLERGQPRVINNITATAKANKKHHQKLGKQGYASSYTMPMFSNDEFFGFLFFNSYVENVFNDDVLETLDLNGHLITSTIINEMSSIKNLTAVLKSTAQITHKRDPETGAHLERMSRFSRLIAQTLAEKHQLDDHYIEHIFMFAPLHDIGKIAIPDDILLKPGKLSADEMEIMKTHAVKGKEMIDDLLNNFGLSNISHTDILRNIAASHHEKINGHGYPEGKAGDAVPLEARIIAVADIFDALTNERVYKKAWSNDEAFAALKEMAGEELDEDCVNALIKQRKEVEEVQQHFKEETPS